MRSSDFRREKRSRNPWRRSRLLGQGRAELATHTEMDGDGHTASCESSVQSGPSWPLIVSW